MSKLEDVTKEWFNENIKDENKNFVEEFLTQAHLSPKTLIQYQSALYQFFKFIHDKCENKLLTELKPRDALKYQNFLINRGLSSSAVKLKRSAVSSLCGYIELYYNDSHPLFRNIYNKKIPNPPKAFKNKKEPLNKEEFDNLVEELVNKEEWQMIAYLMFTFETGCRREESRQLLRSFVNHEKIKDPVTGETKKYYMTSEIRCKGRGREGKIRKFPVGELAMIALKKWDEIRGEDDCEFMFVNKTKDGVTTQVAASTFNYWCTEVFSKIVGRRVHPHLIRSSRATVLSNSLDENGKPITIEKIQKLLGHESPDTTKIYIIKEGEDELDDLF